MEHGDGTWYFVILGKYPLTISNTWSTTKLFINDGVPEILEFKKRLFIVYNK
jgi:hypothetical protein